MAEQASRPRQAVIVISSHVARGSVGNRAGVFALETLGHPVWAVPTVTLAWHPGHGPSTRIVPDPAAFAALLADLARAPWLGEVGAVLSGYLGDAGQAEAVAAVVGAVKAKNPQAIYLCDPVIGDRGGLYVRPELAEAIRDRLVPIADIATPNRHELEWLVGRPLGGIDDLVSAARTLSPAETIVTSAPAEHEGRIGNLLVSDEATALASHDRLERPPHGTGDLFAAAHLAGVMAGLTRVEAMRQASASVAHAVERAVARGADELSLQADCDCLTAPSADIDLHRLSDT